LLVFTGFVRELDVDSIAALSGSSSVLHSNDLEKLLFIAGGASLLCYLIIQRAHALAMIGRMLSGFSWPFVAAIILGFAGAYLMESAFKHIPNAQFIEEQLETAAYLMFLVAALRTLELTLAARNAMIATPAPVKPL
ncbi:MAG: hypothetical protein KKB37_15125, partial [Alphaproteobacteria bacterium]|nr:hypothetical protein [Alphaproteobacteria bacterium]